MYAAAATIGGSFTRRAGIGTGSVDARKAEQVRAPELGLQLAERLHRVGVGDDEALEVFELAGVSSASRDLEEVLDVGAGIAEFDATADGPTAVGTELTDPLIRTAVLTTGASHPDSARLAAGRVCGIVTSWTGIPSRLNRSRTDDGRSLTRSRWECAGTWYTRCSRWT